MGNGVMAIGPKLPRPSSTLPFATDRGIALLCRDLRVEQTKSRGGAADVELVVADGLLAVLLMIYSP
jgi:hypothetical protein